MVVPNLVQRYIKSLKCIFLISRYIEELYNQKSVYLNEIICCATEVGIEDRRIIFSLDIRVGISRYFFRGTQNIINLLKDREDHFQPRYQGRHQEILFPRHLEHYKLIRGQERIIFNSISRSVSEVIPPGDLEHAKLIRGQVRIIFSLDIRVGIRRYFFRGTQNIKNLLEDKRGSFLTRYQGRYQE